MSYLPEEIIFDILTRLPAKCILRSWCVCKSWFELFKSPNFVSMHLHHNTSIGNNNISLMFTEYEYDDRDRIRSIEYDSSSHSMLSDREVEIEYPLKYAGYTGVRIEATCNGLVCLTLSRDFKAATLVLWNPCTREYKEIPKPYTYDFEHRMSFKVLYGFAYDIDDYKLVRIVNFGPKISELRVFTLGSNSWKNINLIKYRNFTREQPEVFIHRAFHWTATAADSNFTSVVSYDIGEETVKEVPKPKYLDEKVSIALCLLEGCLCIVSHTKEVSTDVWMMKEYRVGDSWTSYSLLLNT